MKDIFIINGSASEGSSNQHLIEYLGSKCMGFFRFKVYESLKALPHFDPELSVQNVPVEVADFRQQISVADGVLICTPEYVFSIPSGLKNALEWCVATTIFSNKPLGIITASANGEKAQQELQLIMRTLGASFTPATTLLIQGIKGKVKENGRVTDIPTKDALDKLMLAFKTLMK